MSKYIDTDTLIAEIKRRRDRALKRQKNLEKIRQETVLNKAIAFELNKILSFITSLQQEQPEVDLEKEIDKYMYPIQSWEVQEEPFTSLEKCARHFYELGLNARKEE